MRCSPFRESNDLGSSGSMGISVRQLVVTRVLLGREHGRHGGVKT